MKDRILYIFLLIGLSLTLSVSSFFVGSLINNVFSQKMPDLSESTKQDVLNWIDEKLLTNVEIVEEYSNTVSEGHVISQSVDADINISRSTLIIVRISLGSDLNEIIRIPDFTGQDIGVIQRWIQSNYLTNAEIEFEKNETIQASIFVRSNRVSTSMKRSDPIKFTISTGNQQTLNKIIMRDLVGLSDEEANRWAKEQGIHLIYDHVYSDEVDANHIISQSVAKNIEVWSGSSVQIVISKGPSITLVNFYNMSVSKINQYISSYGLKVEYSYQYDNQISENHALSMSPSAYTTVEKNTTVHVTISLGQIERPDVEGMTKEDFNGWIDEINLSGGSLSYEYIIDQKSSNIEIGLITRIDPLENVIPIGSHIKVYISQGELIVLPDINDIIGHPVSKIKSRLEKLGLIVVIEEIDSVNEPGTILSIDPLPGSVLKPGNTVILVVAKSKV